MVFDDASWDTLINDSVDKFVQRLEKEFREDAEFRKEVLRHERWRVTEKREQIKRNVSEQKQEAEKQAYAKLQRMRELKKLKKRRKDQRKKVMKIRRQTWIAFRIFVMIFRSEIVTLDTLDIEFTNYKHANSSPISLEKRSFQEIRKRKSCICATNIGNWNTAKLN
ncbi:hypothetical protein CRE_24659 [Caenorhabditis remanei]|uniref:Uncharacterized protein n=1 Tax=Caenorhabditis remanei TaxID=31234 RepID=E3N3Y2_CAERE|nr:hypothetical protein CRE_24659 [Caenorhabditis remanei]